MDDMKKFIEGIEQQLSGKSGFSFDFQRSASDKSYAILVTAAYLVDVIAQKTGEFEKFETMPLNVALKRYSRYGKIFGVARKWLREHLVRDVLDEPFAQYLKGPMPKTWKMADIGYAACYAAFDNGAYSAQGTNCAVNLAKTVMRFRNGNGPVVLTMDQMGFLPYCLAMEGITCIVRFFDFCDVLLASLLSIFVEGRIRAELIKVPEDMYRKVKGPVSLVVCLSGSSLVLETTDEKAKKRWQSLPEKFSWYSGTLLSFLMERRRLDKWKRQEEERVFKELVETGCLKKEVKLPFKAGSEPEYRPIMLCLDLSADRSNNGVQIVDISHGLFWDKIGKEGQENPNYHFLKTDVVNDLLFTDRLLGNPVYADYFCRCSLAEFTEYRCSLDVSYYLWGAENKVALQVARERGVPLLRLAWVITCSRKPTVPEEGGESRNCFVLTASDLSHNHGIHQPTKSVCVECSYAEKYRVRQGDILVSTRNPKGQMPVIAYLSEECPDNLVISPSLAIIRLKDEESLKRLPDPLGFWHPKRLFKYLTSKWVSAYLENKFRHSGATTTFPMDILRELPVIAGGMEMQAAEKLEHQFRMKVLEENYGFSVPWDSV